MRGLLTLSAAATLCAAPAQAEDATASEQPISETGAIFEAVDQFMAALGDPDRTKLAERMVPSGVIFVHNRMDPENPRVDAIPIAQHLESWLTRTATYEETMFTRYVLVDGDMAHAWGPYRFVADGVTTHCGINSMSFVKTEDGWKVGNTSFTMEPPEKCDALEAPEASQ